VLQRPNNSFKADGYPALANMRMLALIALTFVCSQTLASPCSAVSQKLTNAQKVTWAPVLAQQLKTSSVSVQQVFSFANWHIVYVETLDSDLPFLLFKGDPLHSHFVTTWSGAARATEEQSIRAWAIQHAPGIPSPLASCFAWHVSKARDK
jgi:hypothetical protein